jgi:hypothetical protein
MGNELTTFEMFALVVCVVDLMLWASFGAIGGLLVWHKKLVGEGSEE